jgi:hypothetical protein
VNSAILHWLESEALHVPSGRCGGSGFHVFLPRGIRTGRPGTRETRRTMRFVSFSAIAAVMLFNDGRPCRRRPNVACIMSENGVFRKGFMGARQEARFEAESASGKLKKKAKP